MTTRYVAGLSVKDGTPVGHIVALEEDENGERLGQAFLANDMTYEQVDHLHMQLGKLKTVLQPGGDE